MNVRFLFEFDRLGFEKGANYPVVGSFLANRWQSLGIPFQARGLAGLGEFLLCYLA